MEGLKKIGDRWMRLSAITLVEEKGAGLLVHLADGHSRKFKGGDAEALKKALEELLKPVVVSARSRP